MDSETNREDSQVFSVFFSNSQAGEIGNTGISVIIEYKIECSGEGWRCRTVFFSYLTARHGLILRESCSMHSERILLLPYGTGIRIIRKDRNDYINNIHAPWYIVKYHSYIGCVFGGYINI